MSRSHSQSESVFAELVQHAYGQTLIGIVATVVNSLILSFFLRNLIETDVLIGWVAAAISVSVIRLLLYVRYRKAAAMPEEARFWGAVMTAGLGAAGAVWGASTIFLFPAGSFLHQALVAITLAGMVAGALSAYSGLTSAFLVFALPTLTPLIIRCLVIGGEVHTAIGILGILFLLMSCLNARQIGKSIANQFLLQKHFAREVDQRTSLLSSANAQLMRENAERKKAESALRESEERFRSMSAAAHDAIIMIDYEGNISYWNESAQKILGYSGKEVLGKNLHETLAPKRFLKDHQREFAGFRKNGLGAAIGKTLELSALRKDGTEIPIELSLSAVKLAGKWNAIGMLRDITERKAAEAALQKANNDLERRVRQRTSELETAKNIAERANTAKSQFLANMSHELRTPLNHIIGFSELLMDKNFGDLSPVQEEYLGDVVKSGHHLLALINDILDLSKVEAGRVELDLSEVDIRALLEHSMVMVQEKALTHGIRLNTDIAELPAKIVADERKLKQILYNLLANAVKYSPDGGRIDLKAGLVSQPGFSDRLIKVSVADSGIGIKDQDLQRIFEPFEQADGKITRKFQGTGLGLALTREFVSLHGGRIWAGSAGEGMGAEFSFVLPLNPAA